MLHVLHAPWQWLHQLHLVASVQKDGMYDMMPHLGQASLCTLCALTDHITISESRSVRRID